jgi:hypothetical protein
MINIFVFSDNFSHLSITKSCKEEEEEGRKINGCRNG